MQWNKELKRLRKETGFHITSIFLFYLFTFLLILVDRIGHVQQQCRKGKITKIIPLKVK